MRIVLHAGKYARCNLTLDLRGPRCLGNAEIGKPTTARAGSAHRAATFPSTLAIFKDPREKMIEREPREYYGLAGLHHRLSLLHMEVNNITSLG
jgi:hypothetical protein